MRCSPDLQVEEVGSETWTLEGVSRYEADRHADLAEVVTAWLPGGAGAGIAAIFAGSRNGIAAVSFGSGSIPSLTLVEGLERTTCCGSDTGVKGNAGGQRLSLTRLHRMDTLAVDLPTFEREYMPRTARSTALGDPVQLKAGQVDRLQPLGHLVSEGDAYLLWADADRQPRGWERVTSLVLPVLPRFGHCNEPLLFTREGPRGFAQPELSGIELSVKRQMEGIRSLL